MPIKPDPSIPPEVFLADKILRKMPRARLIPEGELWRDVNWKDAHERELYNEYRELALEVLLKEKYIEPQHGVGLHRNQGTQYRLTADGRALLDAGGYLDSWCKRHQLQSFSREVNRAEGKKKIWDNRTKYIVLGISIFSAFILALGLLGKYAAESRKPDANAQLISANDSALKQMQARLRNDSIRTASKRHHPKTALIKDPVVSHTASDNTTVDHQQQSPLSSPEPKISAPTRIATSDAIEFRLLKVQGNSRTQSITITMTLTNTAATRQFNSFAKPIIDTEGNEYKLRSYTLGSEDYSTMVELTTGVPLKCTFTFGGILSDVKMIRLFNYSYYQNFQVVSVGFRDLPVDWN